MIKQVFYLSDSTGITVETLGHTLLTQFGDVEFNKIHRPYLQDVYAVKKVITEINQSASEQQSPPIVFSTLVCSESRALLKQSKALLFDLFDMFIEPIEAKLNLKSTREVGRSHGMGMYEDYKTRIDAVHFAITNDDGVSTQYYDKANIIMVGVSRCGKTPTCLYLAINYGIHAANYPLTIEDLESEHIPDALKPYRQKLYGLNIHPTRLSQIRKERRPNSRYAELSQCQFEVRSAVALFQKENLDFLDTSSMSIEEISAHILDDTGLQRRINE